MALDSEGFRCALVSYDLRGNEVAISPNSQKLLNAEEGQKVFLSPFHYSKISKKEQT
jgi:hypothetical protein